jgi:hypothetical protein
VGHARRRAAVDHGHGHGAGAVGVPTVPYQHGPEVAIGHPMHTTVPVRKSRKYDATGSSSRPSRISMRTRNGRRSRPRTVAGAPHPARRQPGSSVGVECVVALVHRAFEDLLAQGARPKSGECAVAILDESGLTFGVGPLRALAHGPLVARAEEELRNGRFPIIISDERSRSAIITSIAIVPTLGAADRPS